MSKETAPRFAGIGGHHSAKPGTVEWLTPPEIIAALDPPFDLDPCAPIAQPYPTALRTFTLVDNGLLQRWEGRVWLNPPYSTGEIDKWLARMAEHDRGTALIFARTETDAFFRHVWERASALLFMRGRINFHLPDGTRAGGNAGAPTVLCAYGTRDADVLAGCEIDGHFVPLIFPRSVLGAALRDATWAEIVCSALESFDGPVRVRDVWEIVKGHSKATGKPNARAKVRQTLQLRAKSLGPDQWVRAQA